ncbi:MAG: hypothetical protein ABIW76_00695 [Fibrobacteria bacterium]
MHSDSNRFHLPRGLSLACVVLGLSCATRAEDPLLGRIKLIKCVGCDPGAVNLVLHDPIDVVDFEVQIKEGDYQKVVTPLAGKTVYEKNGCFYWMDRPNQAKAPGNDPVKAAPGKQEDKSSSNPTGMKNADDSTKTEGRLMETSAPPVPEIEGKPSRCIPFTRIVVKPTHPNGKKEEE